MSTPLNEEKDESSVVHIQCNSQPTLFNDRNEREACRSGLWMTELGLDSDTMDCFRPLCFIFYLFFPRMPLFLA